MGIEEFKDLGIVRKPIPEFVILQSSWGYIEGLTTDFAVKGRVTGQNPMVTLYTSRSYCQRLMKMEFGGPEEMKSRVVSEQKK